MTLTINAPPARGSRWSVYSLRMVGLTRLELVTSRLSGVRSNHLSYRPATKVLRYNKTDLYSLARIILNFFSTSLEVSPDLVKLRTPNRSPRSKRRFPRRKAAPWPSATYRRPAPEVPEPAFERILFAARRYDNSRETGANPFRRPTARHRLRRRHSTPRRSTTPGWDRPRQVRRPFSGASSSNRWR